MPLVKKGSKLKKGHRRFRAKKKPKVKDTRSRRFKLRFKNSRKLA